MNQLVNPAPHLYREIGIDWDGHWQQQFEGGLPCFLEHGDQRSLWGFAEPLFTLPFARLVVDRYNEAVDPATEIYFEWAGETLLQCHPPSSIDETGSVYELRANEHGLIALEAGWVWDLVRDDDQAARAALDSHRRAQASVSRSRAAQARLVLARRAAKTALCG